MVIRIPRISAISSCVISMTSPELEGWFIVKRYSKSQSLTWNELYSWWIVSNRNCLHTYAFSLRWTVVRSRQSNCESLNWYCTQKVATRLLFPLYKEQSRWSVITHKFIGSASMRPALWWQLFVILSLRSMFPSYILDSREESSLIPYLPIFVTLFCFHRQDNISIPCVLLYCFSYP